VASYEVRITRSAEKELNGLPKSIVPVIWGRIKALASEPKPKRSRKLKGAEKAYRLRIRDYRVVYTVDDKEQLVIVAAVRHRKEVYRG
jgi:mRNA interferase RelE/StbE